MYRYFYAKDIGSVSLDKVYCSEGSFNSNSEDNFDEFQVVATISNPPTNRNIYLSSSHIILNSINSGYILNVYSYPFMFFNY